MKEQYYALTLDDYALPGIASGDKQYFGTLGEIASLINSLMADEKLSKDHGCLIDAFDKFCSGDTEVTHYVAYNQHRLLQPVNLIATFEHEMRDYTWEHKNIYGFPYYMRFKSAKVKHYWFQAENNYFRCLSADVVGLQYKNTCGEWLNRDDDYWGFPNIIINEPPHTRTQLAVQEKVFRSIDELQNDDENFEPGIDINFTEFCNDIFGDG